MIISGIYKIINKVNGKYYIGRSHNIVGRWHEHRYLLRHNKHYNKIIQNAWNKYGEDNFIFEVIKTCEKSEIKQVEQRFIDIAKGEYNITSSSFGLSKGESFLTEDGRIRLSERWKGENNPRVKNKICIPHNEETKLKISNSLMNHPVSDETRKKQCENHRSKKGYEPWNKGKKGSQVPWNKGLNKEIDERVKKCSQPSKKRSEGIKKGWETRRRKQNGNII